MKLNVLTFYFLILGDMPRDPSKGPIVARKFFGHSAFKIELLDLRSEASTEGILGNKYSIIRKRRAISFVPSIL